MSHLQLCPASRQKGPTPSHRCPDLQAQGGLSLCSSRSPEPGPTDLGGLGETGDPGDRETQPGPLMLYVVLLCSSGGKAD